MTTSALGVTRVGLIGLGMVADMHAVAIAECDGVTLHGVMSRSPQSREAFAARHAVPHSYDSVAQLASDPAIDMVIVATPPDARADIAAQLAGAGKPTLMEKPLERDTPRARAIVACYAEAGVPLGAVLQHRMRGAVAALRPQLSALGTIGSVEVRVPWWRPQSYYDTPGRGTYARDGGGVLITQAIHTLDLMLHLAGPVTHVQALTGTSPVHEMEAENIAAAALRFASGAVGSVVASTTHYPGGAEEIILNGTEGSAWLSSDSLRLSFHDGRDIAHGTASATGGGADPMAFSADWHRAVIADFASALRKRQQPSIPADQALAVHALIDAITASARGGTATSPQDY